MFYTPYVSCHLVSSCPATSTQKWNLRHSGRGGKQKWLGILLLFCLSAMTNDHVFLPTHTTHTYPKKHSAFRPTAVVRSSLPSPIHFRLRLLLYLLTLRGNFLSLVVKNLLKYPAKYYNSSRRVKRSK